MARVTLSKFIKSYGNLEGVHGIPVTIGNILCCQLNLDRSHLFAAGTQKSPGWEYDYTHIH